MMKQKGCNHHHKLLKEQLLHNVDFEEELPWEDPKIILIYIFITKHLISLNILQHKYISNVLTL